MATTANVRDALFCPECGGIECCDDECARAKRQIAQYKRREREKAERAVIEAAKAWQQWRMGYGGLLVHSSEDALFDAIEALDKAEE